MGLNIIEPQADAGDLPDGWRVTLIKEISTPVRGGSPRPAGDPRYFDGSYIPWLTVAAMTNIPNSQLEVCSTATCLTEEGAQYSRTLLRGTLIIANSGATLGVAKILGIKCCANDGIAALLNLSCDISSRYVAYFINSRTRYLRDVVATGNGQPNLNTDLIGNFKILLPPTKLEQEAIADALNDADSLIDSLERLLAKNRDIKQGAMQELLTGTRRLPGFKGTWEIRDLRDVCTKIQDGTHYSPRLRGNDFLYITSKNIGYGTFDITSAERISKFEHAKIYARCDVVKGDLLLTKDGANTGNAALNPLDEPFSLLSSVAMLRFNSHHHDPRYFLNQILCPEGQQQIKDMMSGNAITRLTLAKIRSLHFPVAPTDEQKAIADLRNPLISID